MKSGAPDRPAKAMELSGPSLFAMPASSAEAFPQLVEIYNRYRSAALNKDYYGCLLAEYQRWNTWLEFAIAIGAAGSGISGLAVWHYDTGKTLWAMITAISSLLAIVKPFLQLNKKVERYSKLFTGHQDNYLSLTVLVSKIRRRRQLTLEMIQEFEGAENRYIELARDDDPAINLTLATKCEARVREQIPDSALWYPEDTGT
jgi:hypothetical protein